MVFQHHGAQHRGQRQGDQGRNDNGAGHGDGELPVEHTHRARHEGHRHEHRHHHQRDGDNGPADLAKHFLDRPIGRQMCFSSILACTASTTTMASSTTIPMASTSAKSVIRLMERPNNCMTKNAPISDTGTARIGIRVERQSPRNRNTTRATRMKASRNVWITCSIEASRKLRHVVADFIVHARRKGCLSSLRASFSRRQ